MITNILKVADEDLLLHFTKIDLDCTIFLQRWYRCLFNREFHYIDVLILWDNLFSCNYLEINSNKLSYSIMSFIDYFSAAMIIYIREDCKHVFKISIKKGPK